MMPMQPAGYFWRGPHVETGAKTPGTMPNLYQTGQSREAQLWIFEKSEDQKDDAPCVSGSFPFSLCLQSSGKDCHTLPKEGEKPRFFGGVLKGRDGRSWRKFVALCKRELPPVCFYCGGIIDMGLHHNDAMSWTIDHITPLVAGGAPEDLSNAAPAHRRCNSIKGTKQNYTATKPKQSRVW
jgi:5-methylcytosine-specific restriction endonuclease McrA